MTTNTIRARVHERVIQGARTMDAARPTKDALLTCPTAEEWAAYSRSIAQVDLGKVWDGLEAQLEGLDQKQREMICDRFDVYRELKKVAKASDALDAAPDFDPHGRRESAKLGDEINARNGAMWGQKHVPGRGVTRE